MILCFIHYSLIPDSISALASLGVETVPAPARGAASEELLRLESAATALVAHHALAVRRHQAFFHLQQLALFGAGIDKLGLQQTIQRTQGGVAPQLLARQLAGGRPALR